MLAGGAVATGVGLAGPLTRDAAGAQAAGLVQEVKGQATAQLASMQRILIASGDVFVGDDVTTAESSRLSMLLGRDTSLRLGASARVKIDRFIVNAGGVLTLESGPLLLEKMPDGPSRAIQVRGAFGMIAIRGTKIFVGPSKGVTGIFVVHGVITVTVAGNAFVLQTGEGTDIASPGGPATPPSIWGEPRIRAALASVT
jgi:hypothetical protein